MTYENPGWGPLAPPPVPKGNAGAKIAAIICGTLIVLAVIGAVGVVVGDNDQERDGFAPSAVEDVEPVRPVEPDEGLVSEADPEGVLTADMYDTLAQIEWDGMDLETQLSICNGVDLLGLSAMSEAAVADQGLSPDDPVVVAFAAVVGRECS